MKVLLLNPLYRQSLGDRYERYFIHSGSRWPHSGVKLKGAIPHYLPFPFNLAYAAAYLRGTCFEPCVIDAVALNLSEDSLLQEISRIDPDAVFYEFTTPTVERDLVLADRIKRSTRARVIIGGAHAAYFACEIIRKYKAIDFIIRGEYEYTLAQLMRALAENRSCQIAGVVYLTNGSVVDNGCPRGQDFLKVPLREIFPSNDQPDPTVYWDGFCQLRPALQLQSSRGCKYSCSFCLNSQAAGNPAKYQVLPAEEVCAAIINAKKMYGIREVYFDDDNFTQDMQHVDDIFGLMQGKKASIKWSAMSGFSILTPEVIRRLVDYGCIGLKLGIESASRQVLKGIHKPIDLDHVAGMISCLRRYGIKTHLTFSIGFLDETLVDIKRTISHAQSLAADSIQLSIATPFPGTEFFEQAKARNLLSAVPWENYDGKRTSVICSSSFNPQALGRIRRSGLRNWFIRRIFSPLWLIAHLRVILRSLNGLGCTVFFKQLFEVLIDENKNR